MEDHLTPLEIEGFIDGSLDHRERERILGSGLV